MSEVKAVLSGLAESAVVRDGAFDRAVSKSE